MREIKFRAFIKATQKIIDVEWIDFKNKQITYNSIDFKEFGLVEQTKFDEIELLEYTGLKDKNGQEIFEGDIVSFVVFDTTGGHQVDKEYKGVIKYQSGIYEVWKSNETEWFQLDGPFILNHVWLQDDEFEVVGNIYKNPNLLEETA